MGSGTVYIAIIAAVFVLFFGWILFSLQRKGRLGRNGRGNLIDSVAGTLLGGIILRPFMPVIRSVRARRERLCAARREAKRLEAARWSARKEWAREDGMDAKKRSSPASSTSTVDLEAAKGSNDRRSHLEALPSELRIQIYAQLDYCSALALESTNRFFRHDVPTYAIDREERATYAYHAETFAINRGRLACFDCLRLRELVAFAEEMRVGEFERFGLFAKKESLKIDDSPTMPTYLVRTATGHLNASQKQAIVDKVTTIHSEEGGGVPQYLVQVIFEEVQPGNWFINKNMAPAEQIWIRGDIRAGRSDEQKSAMAERMMAECSAATGLGRSFFWVYICDVEKAAEFGSILPKPGEEKKWVESLSKEVRDRYGLY